MTPDSTPASSTAPASSTTPASAAAQAPSFVKQAMRNMVRKGRQSLLHFGLTALGFVGFILLVATLGRPSLPQ